MAGELWRQTAQIGKETTYGTLVAPTRRLYVMNPSLQEAGEAELFQYATASRDNQRSGAAPVNMVEGSIEVPMSPDELLEWLAITIQGGVSPTTPAGGTLARDYQFRPSTTVDSATLEYDDGARAWVATGVLGNSWEIAGDVDGDNIFTLELMGNTLELQALTSPPAARTPHQSRGWETKVLIGTFDTDISASSVAPIPNLLKSWRISGENGLERKYLASNTQAAQAVIQGPMVLTAELTIEASDAQALTEWNAFRAGTYRQVRLEFGLNTQIEAAPTNELQTVTITGTPTGGTFTLTFRGQTTGTIAYNATAATVKSALESLRTIGRGNVTVGGGPGPGTPYTVTFVNQLGGLDVAQMTAAHSFTGGSSPNISVATTTPGVGYKKAVFVDIPGIWQSFELGEEDAGTRMYRGTLAYIYAPTLTYGLQIVCRTNRTSIWSA